MSVTWLCVGLLGLLPFGLGFWVSINRGRSKTNYHFNPDPTDPLYKAVRIHANTAEYVPALMILIVALNQIMPGALTMWLAVIATLCRYLFVIGMMMSPTLDKPNPLRVIGAAGTYFVGLIMAVALIIAVL